MDDFDQGSKPADYAAHDCMSIENNICACCNQN